VTRGLVPGPVPSPPRPRQGRLQTFTRGFHKEGGKLTLKHADIKSLDMPAMTMVFVVKDKAMLDKLKAGDKIKFKAINDAGKYTVAELQTAP
jgi:Cu(I)/Ag(I) efflux system protein CusF